MCETWQQVIIVCTYLCTLAAEPDIGGVIVGRTERILILTMRCAMQVEAVGMADAVQVAVARQAVFAFGAGIGRADLAL